MPEKDVIPTKREVASAFGGVLQRYRRERGLTQEQLAEAGQVSTQYVSLMERGIHQPSLHTLVMMARALGAEVPNLVEEAMRALPHR